MLRPSRRLAGVLLWLLLALLPLRGLAHGWMGLAPLHDTPPAHAPAMMTTDMPCHSQAADGVASIGHHAPQAAACVMCDLCHGALALPQAAQPPGDEAAAAPCPAWSASPPVILAGRRLFRPPRS